MLSRLRRILSPATVISVLALFVALGGAGYAATTIGSTQIANNSVASVDIRNGTIVPKDLSPRAVSALRGGAGPAGPAGAPGAAGSPGAPATSMFAYVRVADSDALDLAFGNGVIRAERVPVTSVPGRVDVTFARDLRGCVVHATPGVGAPRGAADFNDVRIGVVVDPEAAPGVADNVARVLTFAGGGGNNSFDASFMISAFC